MKEKPKTKQRSLGKQSLRLLLLLLTFNSLNAQQRTWMIPYYQNLGSVSSTGGVNRVPLINFKTSVPTYETKYIGGSFSTQAVGNGEYCNNCATDQLTKLSQFFISGRAADSYQGNANPNPLRTLYTKWEQICGDTARVDTFQTINHADLAHESLNEIAVGDGETPGTFWVLMQQSPAGTDGFGPGFYVYLMDMNNSTINSNTILQIDNAHFSSIPAGNTLGEGVALGPKFKYVMQTGETNTNLINLNGKFCRSIYIASYNTIYHLLIDLALKTVVYSDSAPMTGGNLSAGNMFMEIDLCYPKNGKHPTNLGLTGWGGVFIYNVSQDHGKILATTQPNITGAVGGYGLEFDKNGTNLYYSLHGSSAAATLYRVATSVINSSTAISPTTLSITPALGTNITGNSNNYLALESAIDGNIYGVTSNQELVTITHPELSPTTASSLQFTAGMFHNPTNGATDLNPSNNTSFYFGVSLPDWVDGEVPHSSEGGTIAVKVPCNLCNETYAQHTIDIYAGTPAASTLVQHYNVLPCDSVDIKVCPGVDYHVIYDQGLPNQQDSWVSIAFAGDYHLLTFNLSAYSSNYIQYNTNTTISTNTLWDDKVYIGDNVIVTVASGVTLDITNVDVIFGSDAGIDFKNGAILRANNSVFRPCDMNAVWRGLAFYTSNSIAPLGLINECTFKNAKTAIEALGTSSTTLLSLDLRITNNLFADCQRGIGFNYVDFKRSITGNTYMLENKVLPFSSINTGSINPPKTTAPTNQNDYYGLFSNYTTFHDMIGQNDFVMTSDQTTGDQMSYGISLYNSSNPVIASNKLTDFSYSITANTTNGVSIEENTVEWTNLYKKVIPGQYKFHITTYYGQNILIKGNRLYSANLINTNPGTIQLDGGTNGPSTPTWKSCGIGIVTCNNVVIKQNEIIGIETGISAIGTNPASTVSKNMFISENEIKKAWYYGIYFRSYENIDISCNTIDMELKTGRDATGIGYFNFSVDGINYVHPVNVGIRSNCVLNTKNAVYCYNIPAAGTTNIPKIYNNFCYNYTRVGFENNGFTKVSTSSPYDLNRNSFVSNNSLSGLADIITDVPHPLFGDYNYGVQNVSGSGSITLNNGTNGNSTASCAMQSSTNANSLNATQICDYFYPAQSSWTPNGKVSDWQYVGLDPSETIGQPFDLSDPVYGSVTSIESVLQKMFDMYPVPTKDKVTIAYNLEKTDNAFLEIIDIQGRLLKTVPLTFEHSTVDVNVSELNNGVYIVRMINEGKTAYYSKLVKQ